MPTPLELRLHDLAAAFARRIAGMIGELSIEELAALCGEGDVPVAKAPRKKARPAPKAKPKARRKAKAAAKGGPRTVVVVDGPQEPQGPSMSSMQSMSSLGAPAPPQSRHSPPKLQRRRGDGGPPPEDRAAAFRRAEQERLETAVLKFVSQNPGTDAEIVAVRVGLPKGKAQGLLDDLVLKGRLRMKSGQHGRCYVGVERG